MAFDFDGTLVDSNAVKRNTFFEVVSHIPGGEKLIGHLLDTVDGDRYTLFRRFAQEIKQPEIYDSLVNAYSDQCEAGIVAAPEIKGATSLLKDLKSRGVLLFVNSATPEPAVQVIIKRKKWNGYFERVLGGHGKKVENMKMIFRDFGLTPADMWLIGDNEGDRAAAEKVGCSYIGIENEYSKYKMRPAVVVKDLTEIRHWIPDRDIRG